MTRHDERTTCEEVRAELAGLLYGELDGPDRDRVEAHLADCPACRAEHGGLAETRNLLDAWSPDVPGATVEASREVARAILRPRRSALRPVLLAAAAGILAFLGLASLGADLEHEAGRLTVSFRLPWVPYAPVEDSAFVAEAPPPGGDEWSELVRQVALEHVDEHVVATLEGWSLREEEQRMRLARAIDTVRQRDRASLAELFQAVQRGTVRENRFTREALYELASLVDQEH
jgi:hypothetical protein